MWIRFLISGAIVIPAGMLHVPWWQLLLIAAGGFGSGRIVEVGVDGLDSGKKQQAVLVLAGGLALGIATFAIGVLPRLRPRPAAREAFTKLPEAPAPAPVAPAHQRPGAWRAVSIAGERACAIRDDRTVWCWGQLPSGGNEAVETSEPIAGLANATAIAVGSQTTCALVDGHAWCLGWNYNGVLGVPPTDSHDLRAEPVRVPIDEPLAAIAVGSNHACALAATGAVWCWGAINRTAQQFTDEPARERAEVRGPTRIAVPPARAIAAGLDVSCAIARDDGALTCWGDLGAHGSYAQATVFSSPTAIAGITDATAIAAGAAEICAAQRAAAPACWGTGPALAERIAQVEALRANGKLPAAPAHVNHLGLVPRFDSIDATNDTLRAGRDALAGEPDPRALHRHDELAGATGLAVGDMHACAIVDGDVRCWGHNYQGQLGDGSRTDSPIRAVDVADIPEATQLAVGELESCALTAAGALWCWGHEEPRR